MTRRARTALLPITAIAAAVALTLSGCSATSEKAPEMEEGPLGKYLSALSEGEEWNEEDAEAQNLKVEEAVAACMQKEGFEYEPDVQSMNFSSGEDEEGPQWGTKEFAEQYGYGVTDFPGREAMEESSSSQEYVNVNQEYIDALSESEQNAFYETLHGPQPTEEEWAEMEESGEGYSPDPSEQGCYGNAYLQVAEEEGGSQAAWNDPEFAELFEAMSNVWDQSGSEDVQKLDTEWASCMADAGYPDFKTSDDAQNSIYEAQNALYNYEELAEDEMPEEPKKEDVDKVKKQEIELAVTDFECKQKVKYDETLAKASHAAEQKFVDEHKADLDALLAKYATKSKDK